MIEEKKRQMSQLEKKKVKYLKKMKQVVDWIQQLFLFSKCKITIVSAM